MLLAALAGCSAPPADPAIDTGLHDAEPIDGLLDAGAPDTGPILPRDAGDRAPPIVDVNDDGLDDLVVGADLRGRVYAFHGTGATLATPWATRVAAPIHSFGYRVAVPGDVDGDGIDDLVVGGYGSRVVLHRGSRAGLGTEPIAELSLGGERVAELDGAGDLDGDGANEVLVSDPAGCSVSIVWSGAWAPPRTTVVMRDDPASVCEPPWLGRARGGADVDRDGVPDFVYATEAIGRVIVFRGSRTGAEPLVTIEGPDRATGFASDADLVGDLDGDGHVDLAIESRYERRVYVLWGGDDGYALERATVIDLPEVVRFGTHLTEAGDLDGDGLPDVALAGAGNVTVVFGARDRDLDTTTYRGPRGDFGVPIASLGDVDGDGRPELATAASYFAPQEVFILRVETDRAVVPIQRIRGDDPTGEGAERFGASIAGR